MKPLVIAGMSILLSLSLISSTEAAAPKSVKQTYTIVDAKNKKYTVSVQSKAASCRKATVDDFWWVKGKDSLCTGKFSLYVNNTSTAYRYTFSKDFPYVIATHDFRTSGKLKNVSGHPTVFSLSFRETPSYMSLTTFSIQNGKLIRHPGTVMSYGMRPKMKSDLLQVPIYSNAGDEVGFLFQDKKLSKGKWVKGKEHSFLSSSFNSKTYKKGVQEWNAYSSKTNYFVK
ncbi:MULTISPECIES: hypothetical protein [unclassified Exiguobacterium]|uniref:hypothetical protein n=1 Tax=unclassified Exiguobacterium TaxID=2644629 RepID=UPI000EE7CEE3|nr:MULTISPECIES: hypothetical protein [unclassified Exiguobacterium]MDT0173978.1 hypothetical protein [Exiguobacterium sp. BRG2]HAL01199.1 hypothetical protein [Exiguobacterium sp.]HCV52034.1 hypothetical protein [Exiguobacterium sp.]